MGKIRFLPVLNLPAYRKIAFGSWQTVGDPSVYGLIELDMSHALLYMKEVEQKHGTKLTPAHLVGKACANVLKQRPEINGMIRLGKIYRRAGVDLFYQVNVPGEEKNGKVTGASLSGVVIRNADQMSALDIARELKARAEMVRSGQDREMKAAVGMMSKIPWMLMRPILNMTSFLNYDLNLNLSWAGIPSDPFGSVMITNIGSLGIDLAWAPLVPYSRVPLLLTLGAIKEGPIVENGKLEVRPVMKIGVTFDHRFMDGVHAAEMAKAFRDCFQDPWKFLHPGQMS